MRATGAAGSLIFTARRAFVYPWLQLLIETATSVRRDGAVIADDAVAGRRSVASASLLLDDALQSNG